MLDGTLDFGVVTTPVSPAAPGLRRIPLVSAAVGVWVRTDHPLAGRDHVHWRDLETWPIVTMRAGTVLWEMLHRHMADPDVVVQAMSARTVKVMVGRGPGSASSPASTRRRTSPSWSGSPCGTRRPSSCA